MASPENPKSAHRRAFWVSIVKTLLVQVLTLIALAGAAVAYLNWSSEVAWSEFLAASRLHDLEPGQTIRPIKDYRTCNRKN